MLKILQHVDKRQLGYGLYTDNIVEEFAADSS